MRDEYYGDNSDLIKWGVLLHVAHEFGLQQIIQIAYLRDTKWDPIEIDGKEYPLPEPVIDHFRSVRKIVNLPGDPVIQVLDSAFEDRNAYLQEVLSSIGACLDANCLLFLDPDTGLEPPRSKPGWEHVLDSEIRSIWNALRADDVLVCYQHRTNRNSKPWINPKRVQLAKAIAVSIDAVKVAKAPGIASDVVFFFCRKNMQ